MDTPKTVRIGFIGLGQRGPMHVRESMRFENVEIASLCDLYRDRVEDLADYVEEKTGKRPFETQDCDELIAHGGLDAIIVSTSWETHASVAAKCLRAGIATAMEVGGACSEEECRELVEAYESTKTRFFFMENCCYGRRETMLMNMVKDGFFGEIVHCDGAYAHDLRGEVSFGKELRHYRLNHYINDNCENYPTHELGPIARYMDINRGNRMVYLTSMSSKAAGLHKFIMDRKADDLELVNTEFAQGDVVTTSIMCADGRTITLRLDTTLPRTYSRGITIHGTRAFYSEEGDFFFEDAVRTGSTMHSSRKLWGNAKDYEEKYLADAWREEIKGGHGGMDYVMLDDFYKKLRSGEDFPIDIYDAVAWMCISYLSAESIKNGSAPVEIPDFTNGKWAERK